MGDKNEEERQTAKNIQPEVTGLGGGCSIGHDSHDRQDADKKNGTVPKEKNGGEIGIRTRDTPLRSILA